MILKKGIIFYLILVGTPGSLTLTIKNRVVGEFTCRAISVKHDKSYRTYSSSLLRSVILYEFTCLLKIFLNLVHFYPNFQEIFAFSTFLCPFSNKIAPTLILLD